MLSKNQIKLITSLKQKKYRQQHELFVVEGKKTIHELLNSKFELEHLFTTTNDFKVLDALKTVIVASDLKKISFLKTPNTALALFKMPVQQPLNFEELVVALDDVRDPGNLGTIIRLCDWFGVKHLLCSKATVDCYNPKVIQATMGSITRVNIVYNSIENVLNTQNVPVFGAFMGGDNIYQNALPSKGVIVMGNEANGISDGVSQLVSQRIAIPRFGEVQETESLNVANATAIILSEFKRRQ
ncbi:MAG: RNA methyltransferase [Flavobacteriaceae bacterium]|nr:RNA methyltransferase [Flavobacteriaceae bacterium]